MPFKKSINVDVDTRKIINEYVTVRVNFKNSFVAWIGLCFIKLGCFISGANYIEDEALGNNNG